VYYFSYLNVINEVAQKKPRPKRKLPDTPGLPTQPPPKPTRKTSDEIPPPKPQRTRAQTSAAVLTTPHVSTVVDIHYIIILHSKLRFQQGKNKFHRRLTHVNSRNKFLWIWKMYEAAVLYHKICEKLA